MTITPNVLDQLSQTYLDLNYRPLQYKSDAPIPIELIRQESVKSVKSCEKIIFSGAILLPDVL